MFYHYISATGGKVGSEQALAISTPAHHREHVFRFGLDVTPTVMVQIPLVLWPLGLLERAASLIGDGVTRVLEAGHVPTIMYWVTWPEDIDYSADFLREVAFPNGLPDQTVR